MDWTATYPCLKGWPRSKITFRWTVTKMCWLSARLLMDFTWLFRHFIRTEIASAVMFFNLNELSIKLLHHFHYFVILQEEMAGFCSLKGHCDCSSFRQPGKNTPSISPFPLSFFGILSQSLWNRNGSPLEQVLDGEFANLKLFCERMKEQFWPHWNRCLNPPTGSVTPAWCVVSACLICCPSICGPLCIIGKCNGRIRLPSWF